MPPPDWFSWEFWAEAAAGVWAGYVANRDNIVPIATVLGAVTIAWAALRQAKTATLRHVEQTTADRERRITESFAKAVEQLGSDKLETRLGGIYTLERLARESAREYWPIMETLTAFVRERAPWPPRQPLGNPFVELQVGDGDETEGENTPAGEPKEGAEPPGAPIRPATDIQAVLTVLGRRAEMARKQDQDKGRRLDLRATYLQGAFLGRAHLEKANLRNSHLEGANLGWAHLEGASFMGAHLQGAKLGRAHLEGANLIEAHLEGANLGWAHLEGANLADAHLQGANLAGAQLQGAVLGAVGLTQKQLEQATGDNRTILPYLVRPAHWSKPQPDE